jgi:predicted RNase H-like HicB family nuclease
MSPVSIRIYLEPNPGGVFTITSRDVPGLVTEGTTPEEIVINVQQALDA